MKKGLDIGAQDGLHYRDFDHTNGLSGVLVSEGILTIILSHRSRTVPQAACQKKSWSSLHMCANAIQQKVQILNYD